MIVFGPQPKIVNLPKRINDGLILNGISDCIVNVGIVTGGRRAVACAFDCRNVRVVGGVYSLPTGHKDSDDNGPHGWLLDNCHGLKFIGPEVERNEDNFEVGYEVFKSTNIEFRKAKLRGKCGKLSVADGATADAGSDDVRFIQPDFDCGGGPAGIVFAFGGGRVIGGKITNCQNKHVIAVNSYYKLIDSNKPQLGWIDCKDDDPDALPVGPVTIKGWDASRVYQGPKGIVVYV